MKFPKKIFKVMKTNTGEHDVFDSEFYYFLCDTVPEDRQLREHLNHMRLDVILENQERDRSRTNFNKMCLFCSAEFNGPYDQVKEFFNHMSEKHHFNVGHPDNMVFIDDFIESIRGRLDGLQCLSCTKCFKDRTTLKDHMRKKSHRALNKEDRSFDKFYLGKHQKTKMCDMFFYFDRITANYGNKSEQRNY
jgi:hypothetical protein